VPRQILQALNRGNVYHFPAGVQNSGKVDIVFANTAGPKDQATVVVTSSNGSSRRHDKVEAGTTRVKQLGLHNNIATIQNIGPSSVQVALTW